MISFVPRCWWQSTRCVRLHSRKATLFRLHMKDHHSPLPPGPPRPTFPGFLRLPQQMLGHGLKIFPLLKLSQGPTKTNVCHPSATGAESSLWPFYPLNPDTGRC